DREAKVRRKAVAAARKKRGGRAAVGVPTARRRMTWAGVGLAFLFVVLANLMAPWGGGERPAPPAVRARGGVPPPPPLPDSPPRPGAAVLNPFAEPKSHLPPDDGLIGEMKFVLVRRGTFWMGWDSEKRLSKMVPVTQDFWLAAYTVTQDQWEE